MPVSAKRYTQYKFEISDLTQRGKWEALFSLSDVSDPEEQKTIASIFSLYDPKNVWKFIDYVSGLGDEKKRENRDGMATACYILGKVGHLNVAKTLNFLRNSLSNDRMLRQPVSAALSNLWVLKTAFIRRALYDSWIIRSKENEDLQQIAVASSEYLTSRAPEQTRTFLFKVANLPKGTQSYRPASRIAQDLLSSYLPESPEERASSSSRNKASRKSKRKGRPKKKKNKR